MSEREDWEGASEEELNDGIDDGNTDAIAEYGSRLYQELQRAKSLLHRWERKSVHVGELYGLRYETVKFLDPLAPPPRRPSHGEP